MYIYIYQRSSLWAVTSSSCEGCYISCKYIFQRSRWDAEISDVLDEHGHGQVIGCHVLLMCGLLHQKYTSVAAETLIYIRHQDIRCISWIDQHGHDQVMGCHVLLVAGLSCQLYICISYIYIYIYMYIYIYNKISEAAETLTYQTSDVSALSWYHVGKGSHADGRSCASTFDRAHRNVIDCCSVFHKAPMLSHRT
jgi:hypothetical protein